MDDNPQSLKEKFLAAVAAAETPGALEAVRIEALGKKGRITALMKNLAAMEPAARKAAGQALNAVKGEIAAAIGARKTNLETAAQDAELMADVKDPSLPPRPENEGRVHPISQTIDEVVAILGEMGFSVAEGPDIEDDWHNFTALNIPPEHPARQEHDTFYMPGEKDGRRKVLRTHTSPVQIHVMETRKPPLRIIAPGRTYRCDYDATHSPMFNQVEGFAVDETTHMGHLKGCLIDFCRAYFGCEDLPIRFRPSYFPFTEPSAEVDIGCNREGGKFRIGHTGGGGTGSDDWLEILGCGMINPNVLKNCGIDPGRYQGFAFGMGVERLAMLKYGIPDLRTFFESDLRWLRHYGFSALNQPNMVFGGGSG